MAYEFLKKFFGENADGTAKAMTFEELESAIAGDKSVQIVDLKAGGYVSKEKLDAKITELGGIKKQLEEANTEIKSYKDMDIDGIKKKADEWEQKYNTDTQKLNDQLATQERNHQMDRYLDGIGLKSGAMYRDYVRKALEAKELKLEDGKFLGADEVVSALRENPDYKDAFVVDEPAGGEPKPSFAPKGGITPPPIKSKMSLADKMKFFNEHPGTDVNTLFE